MQLPVDQENHKCPFRVTSRCKHELVARFVWNSLSQGQAVREPINEAEQGFDIIRRSKRTLSRF